MNTHSKLWWLCYKAIPLVFDNSLSYLEMIAHLISYINNLKDALKELNEKVDNLDSKVENYYQELLQKLEDLEQNLTNLIDNEIAECKDELLGIINQNNTDMNQKIQDFIDYINSLIGEIKDVCFNPTNGHYENVCKILQDIYTNLQIDAMTVNEFDSTDYLTVTYFDDFNITAQEYDIRSKIMLKDFWYNQINNSITELNDNYTQLSEDNTANTEKIGTLENDVDEINQKIATLSGGGDIWLNESDESVISIPINNFVFQNTYIPSGSQIPQSNTNYNVLFKKLTDNSFIMGGQGIGNIVYKASITSKPTILQFFFPNEFYDNFTVPSTFKSTLLGNVYFVNNNEVTSILPLMLQATYNSSNRRYELNFKIAFGQSNTAEYNVIYITINNSILYLN